MNCLWKPTETERTFLESWGSTRFIEYDFVAWTSYCKEFSQRVGSPKGLAIHSHTKKGLLFSCEKSERRLGKRAIGRGTDDLLSKCINAFSVVVVTESSAKRRAEIQDTQRDSTERDRG